MAIPMEYQDSNYIIGKFPLQKKVRDPFCRHQHSIRTGN